MQVSDDIRQRVINEVSRLTQLAARRWPTFRKEPPEVLFDLKGIRAGAAIAAKWQIRLNPVLLCENTEEMISRTTGHEVAHLVASCLWPPARGRNWNHTRPHGSFWQAVMKEFGIEPERTHTFDVSNSKSCSKMTYEYTCSCKDKLLISSIRHNRIRRGYIYLCNKCRNPIEMRKKI